MKKIINEKELSVKVTDVFYHNQMMMVECETSNQKGECDILCVYVDKVTEDANCYKDLYTFDEDGFLFKVHCESSMVADFYSEASEFYKDICSEAIEYVKEHKKPYRGLLCHPSNIYSRTDNMVDAIKSDGCDDKTEYVDNGEKMCEEDINLQLSISVYNGKVTFSNYHLSESYDVDIHSDNLYMQIFDSFISYHCDWIEKVNGNFIYK